MATIRDFLNPVLIKAMQEGIAEIEVCGRKATRKLVVCYANGEYLINRCYTNGIPVDWWERRNARSVRSALEIMDELYGQLVRETEAYAIAA